MLSITPSYIVKWLFVPIGPTKVSLLHNCRPYASPNVRDDGAAEHEPILLVLVFGVAPPSSAKREVMLKLILNDNIAFQSTKIADAIKNPLEATESVAAAHSETAQASWHNALWLYNLCRDFAVESGLTGIRLS
jgi:hypothetical protein